MSSRSDNNLRIALRIYLQKHPDAHDTPLRTKSLGLDSAVRYAVNEYVSTRIFGAYASAHRLKWILLASNRKIEKIVLSFASGTRMNTGEVAFIAVETRKSHEVVFWARRPKIMVIGDRLKMLRETKNLSQG